MIGDIIEHMSHLSPTEPWTYVPHEPAVYGIITSYSPARGIASIIWFAGEHAKSKSTTEMLSVGVLSRRIQQGYWRRIE